MELRHPKIAAVLDVAIGEAEIAIVSEHISGALVHVLLRPPGGKRANVPPPVAMRIAVDVLEALNSLRAPWAELFPVPETEDERVMAAGLHGGLLLDDLLVATFGETILLEAGFSGSVLSIPQFANRPDVVAYRAPEQLEPKGPVDERADLFTVFTIVWELVAGRSLFGPSIMPRPAAAGAVKPKPGSDALQASTARHKVLTTPIPRLDSLPLLKGKVSKELADVVARCLERDRDARFPSLQKAVDAIVALGPAAVASHEVVARFLASLDTVGDDARDAAPARGAAPSNRPTVPPQGDDRDTAPPAPESGERTAVVVAPPLPPDAPVLVDDAPTPAASASEAAVSATITARPTTEEARVAISASRESSSDAPPTVESVTTAPSMSDAPPTEAAATLPSNIDAAPPEGVPAPARHAVEPTSDAPPESVEALSVPSSIEDTQISADPDGAPVSLDADSLAAESLPPSEPIAEQPKPIAEQPKPIAEQPKPIAEQPKPIARRMGAGAPAVAPQRPVAAREVAPSDAEELRVPRSNRTGLFIALAVVAAIVVAVLVRVMTSSAKTESTAAVAPPTPVAAQPGPPAKRAPPEPSVALPAPVAQKPVEQPPAAKAVAAASKPPRPGEEPATAPQAASSGPAPSLADLVKKAQAQSAAAATSKP